MTEFAISVPQLVADGTFDREALRAYLARAEELGFAGAWVTEQVVGSAPNLDSNVLLALCAAYTDRIRLGCAVYVSTLASPLHLAKAIATLDQVSGGRLEVGLGSGGGFRAFGAFGMEREAFVGRFTEALRLMQAAWTQERFSYTGKHYSFPPSRRGSSTRSWSGPDVSRGRSGWPSGSTSPSRTTRRSRSPG